MGMKLGSFTDGPSSHRAPNTVCVTPPDAALLWSDLPASPGESSDFEGSFCVSGAHFSGAKPFPPMYQVPGQSSSPETLQPGWDGNAEPRKEKARSSSRLAPMWQLEPFGEKICSLASGKKETIFEGSEGKQRVSLQLWAAGMGSCLGTGPGSGSDSLCNGPCSPVAWSVPTSLCTRSGGFPAGLGEITAAPRAGGSARHCQGAGTRVGWAGKGLLQQHHTRGWSAHLSELDGIPAAHLGAGLLPTAPWPHAFFPDHPAPGTQGCSGCRLQHQWPWGQSHQSCAVAVLG